MTFQSLEIQPYLFSEFICVQDEHKIANNKE